MCPPPSVDPNQPQAPPDLKVQEPEPSYVMRLVDPNKISEQEKDTDIPDRKTVLGNIRVLTPTHPTQNLQMCIGTDCVCQAQLRASTLLYLSEITTLAGSSKRRENDCPEQKKTDRVQAEPGQQVAAVGVVLSRRITSSVLHPCISKIPMKPQG